MRLEDLHWESATLVLLTFICRSPRKYAFLLFTKERLIIDDGVSQRMCSFDKTS